MWLLVSDWFATTAIHNEFKTKKVNSVLNYNLETMGLYTNMELNLSAMLLTTQLP